MVRINNKIKFLRKDKNYLLKRRNKEVYFVKKLVDDTYNLYKVDKNDNGVITISDYICQLTFNNLKSLKADAIKEKNISDNIFIIGYVFKEKIVKNRKRRGIERV